MATGPRRSLRIQSERRESENGTKRENDPMLTPPATPSPTTRKRKPSQSSKVKKEDGDDDEVKASNTNGKKTTAEKKIATLRASLAQGPFPNHRLPTEGEALRVAEVLTEAHGYQSMPKKQPPRGDDRWGGCGDVASVLDATVRTILSCNTSGANSRNAHKSLCETFGKNNWEAVLNAKQSELAESIKCGGLHENKAKTIQGVLRQTLERHGKLSLDHLHHTDSRTVMEELVSFNGVGPKVASCVSAFCIGNEEMAVDTHVHRLCRKLGWVPDKASRDQTYYHLADRIPGPLRYPLHVLLIKHGKACAECSARGFATDRYASPEWEKEGMSVISGVKPEEWREGEERQFPAVKCPLRAAGLFVKGGARKAMNSDIKVEADAKGKVKKEVDSASKKVKYEKSPEYAVKTEHELPSLEDSPKKAART